MKKLIIFTDAWTPQVNGVVTTLTKLVQLSSWSIEVVNPAMFRTVEFEKIITKANEVDIEW